MHGTQSSNDQRGLKPDNAELVPLFLAHQARIYGFIISLVPNRADAEDLLQETGLVLHRRFDEFRPGTSFLAWACQIAYHKVLDFRKRQSRSHLHFDTNFVEVIAKHQLKDHGTSTSEHAALLSCLEKLPAKDRALVERCYGRHTTIKRVAADLRRPVDTIYKSLRRIRGALFDCVTRTLAAEERA